MKSNVLLAMIITVGAPLSIASDTIYHERGDAVLLEQIQNSSRQSNTFAAITLSRMPAVIGSPNYSGEFRFFSDSAALTFWREPADGSTRLFVKVDPRTASFWFCPGGSSFSIIQGSRDYGQAFRATRGDNASVCQDLKIPEIFLIDQWSTYTNFNVLDAFVISYARTGTSYSGSVTVGASTASTTTTTTSPTTPSTTTSSTTTPSTTTPSTTTPSTTTTTTTPTTTTPTTTTNTCPAQIPDYTASYDPVLNLISVPRLKVPSSLGTVYYKVEMSVVPLSNPMSFLLKSANGVQ